ncbi:LysR family transcriptional regulator [Aliikangiella sp. IMCC44359]|uniref:LysR family transcriptional regulator n=1 Tax=Aliikangiella sp. IMCC44359 TaxID=3459125 RepID=UPI00403A7D13
MLNVDINLLRTFLEIEKTRHFGRAAENLYLTQAAISARIKLLEDTLGIPLFERYRNNIQLTKQGARLLPYATEMVELWIRTTQDVRVPQDYQDLTIAAPESVWNTRLSVLPNLFFENYPKLQLIVQSIDSNIIARRVMDRTTDIGFMYDQPKIDELVVNKVFSIELAFYSNQLVTGVSQISEKNLVTIDLGISFKQIQSKLLPHVSSPIFQAANWQMGIDYITQFGGVMLLPSTLVKDNDKIFRLCDSPILNRDVFMCYTKEFIKNEKQLSYVDFLKKLMVNQLEY